VKRTDQGGEQVVTPNGPQAPQVHSIFHPIAPVRALNRYAKKSASHMNTTELIPTALRDFLAVNEGKRFEFDATKHPEMEVHSVEFFPLDSLPLTSFEIDTYEYHLNHGESGEDPELRYEIEGQRAHAGHTQASGGNGG
jgi:hypothetical protein